MNQEIIDRLSVITEEEQEILSGRSEIDRPAIPKKRS